MLFTHSEVIEVLAFYLFGLFQDGLCSSEQCVQDIYMVGMGVISFFSFQNHLYTQKNYQKGFVYELLHAGVVNFSKECRSEIFLWKDITHKAILFSATYTESAYPVLGFMGRVSL